MARLSLLSLGILVAASCFGGGCNAFSTEPLSAEGNVLGRRQVMQKTFLGVSGLLSTIIAPPSSNAAPTADQKATNNNFFSYKIIPDVSPGPDLNPELKSVAASDLKATLAMTKGNGGALWLGEHHNSVMDHKLQAEFVQDIYDERTRSMGRKAPPMAIGLEQVQVQFQPALDAYIAGKISAEEMKRQVDWEKRWSWSFDGYLPVFETARKLKIPLIALNVDSEDLGLVESGGFPNLPRERLTRYITDTQGFAEFARKSSYKTYVDYVISPSYDMHKDLGILRMTITGQRLEEDMPFSRFFSGRILWDEGMASAANSWTKANPGGLMVGLVGADHVKFQDGIVGRYGRMAKGERDNISVLLNPTLIDTRPSGSVSMAANNSSGADQITLQVRYLKEGVDPSGPERRLPESTGGVLPLADYIVMSARST